MNNSSIKELFTGNIHFKIFFGLLLLAMVTLPFTTWLMLPIAIALLLNWLIEGHFKEKWQHLQLRKALPAWLCLTLPCFVLIPGLIISCNKSEALAAFDCNMWTWIAPLIFLTTAPITFTKKHIHTALKLFTYSTASHILVLIFIAGYKYCTTHHTNHFYYTCFSILLHPSYLAMYCTFGFYFLLNTLLHNKHQHAIFNRCFYLFLMIILFTAILLLQSKAGLLCFFLLAILWTVYYIIQKKKYLIGSLALLLFLGGNLLIFQSGWIQKNRLMESFEQLKERKSNSFGTSSSEIRLTLWRTSTEIIQKNLPWGVGTGDVKQEIKLHALEKNYTNLLQRCYNAHNQYLQSLLETGIPGFIALLCFCFFPLYYSLQKRDLFYFSTALLILLNLTVECMLNVRAGVDFIVLMNVLLFANTFNAENIFST